VGRKEQLLSISKDMVADAYFSKHGFVSVLTANGFDVISRLRDITDLLYLHTGVQKGRRGRPKIYGGKVCYDNLKDGYFTHIKINAAETYFHEIIYARSLKRKIQLVGVQRKKKEN